MIRYLRNTKRMYYLCVVFRNTSRACRIKFEFSKYCRLILPDVVNEEMSGREEMTSIHYSKDVEREKIALLSCMTSFRSRSCRITKFVLRRCCQRRPSNYFEQDPIWTSCVHCCCVFIKLIRERGNTVRYCQAHITDEQGNLLLHLLSFLFLFEFIYSASGITWTKHVIVSHRS